MRHKIKHFGFSSPLGSIRFKPDMKIYPIFKDLQRKRLHNISQEVVPIFLPVIKLLHSNLNPSRSIFSPFPFALPKEGRRTVTHLPNQHYEDIPWAVYFFQQWKLNTQSAVAWVSSTPSKIFRCDIGSFSVHDSPLKSQECSQFNVTFLPSCSNRQGHQISRTISGEQLNSRVTIWIHGSWCKVTDSQWRYIQ